MLEQPQVPHPRLDGQSQLPLPAQDECMFEAGEQSVNTSPLPRLQPDALSLALLSSQDDWMFQMSMLEQPHEATPYP